MRKNNRDLIVDRNFLQLGFLMLFLTATLLGACGKGVSTSTESQRQVTPDGSGNPNPNPGGPGDGFGKNPTGAKLILDFPIDPNNPVRTGALLQGVGGSKTTLRVRFRPGKVKDANGNESATSLSSLSVAASENFGGLSIEPFITEDSLINNEATLLVTVPGGRHEKTRIVTITGMATDSAGSIVQRQVVLMVNTTTILTTNPEYDVITTITFPDLNAGTTDIVKLHMRSTLNSDLVLTGVGELVDEPKGRYAEEDLPFYVPVFGKLALGGGKNPHLQTAPFAMEFPKGTVQDFPGSAVFIKNFCMANDITPNLTTFTGLMECDAGRKVTTELSGLPGLIFPVRGFANGEATTPILPTPTSRGLKLIATDVITAIDMNEGTVDRLDLELFDITTQPDLSIAGKAKLIFTPQVDPSQEPIIVDFSSQPVDLVNLRTVSNPLNLFTPQGMIGDLGFPVDSKNIRLELNITPDFRMTYARKLSGAVAATALGDFPIEGTQFAKMANPPIFPNDPNADINAERLWILGTAGSRTNLSIAFKPGTIQGRNSTVESATLAAFGPDAALIRLDKTSLTAADFGASNVANIGVSVASGVALNVTKIIPVRITGKDSNDVAFTGYGAVTLKRLGEQPPLPAPPPFIFKQFSIRPDVVLSTGDVLKFNTITTSEYGDPGFLNLRGTATLFEPAGVNFVIPVNSVFNAKTREVVTLPINVNVPRGTLVDVAGVEGVRIENLSFKGSFSSDLQTGSLKSVPGGRVILPNGVVNDFEGAALLQLTQSVQTGPNHPKILVNFTPNPVVPGVTKSNPLGLPDDRSILTVTYVPGRNSSGGPTAMEDVSCIAEEDFGILQTHNFVSVGIFAGNVATMVVIPPDTFIPQTGVVIGVTCEVVDSEGQKSSSGDVLVYSNSAFQNPILVPDMTMEIFNTDPEINSTTPPPGTFPFNGDGLRFAVVNQSITPGLFVPIVNGESVLSHYTKAGGWAAYTGANFGGREFRLPFDGTVDLRALVLRSRPIGKGNRCRAGEWGLLPNGPICFPAGEAMEDIQLNGAPANLIVPMENFALNGSFSPDLRTIVVSTAVGCSARLACNGTNLCPYPNPNYGKPCGIADVNPNPFGVVTTVHGLPAVSVPVPLNGFGVAIQN